MKLKMTIAMLVVAGLSAACSQKQAPYEEVRPVRTLVVQAGVTSTSAGYAGEVRARREAPLGFRLAGQIAARYIELGQHVDAGQPLFKLDGRDVALQTASARSQFEKARLDFERTRQLKEKGFISQASLDQAKAAFDVAEAQFKLAANQDGYAVLKAEHSGVVTALNAEVGQVVAAGQPVATVAEDGEREVAVTIPESRVDELRHARALDISLWAVPGKHYQGKLRELAVDTDPATRTYAARVTILSPDDNVRLGMTANVSLPGAADNRGYLLPLTAIYDQDGQPKVWTVDTNSKRVHARPVKVAGAQGENVLVVSGLQVGETIVTAGAHVLHDNELVRLAESQLARP